MARVCQLTGKRPSRGNNRSHAMNATIRRFNPNLFVKKIYDPVLKKFIKLKVSASALRTLAKTSK